MLHVYRMTCAFGGPVARWSAWLLLIAFLPILRSEIVLPSVLSEGMVLQQRSNARLWGKATPGESIYISASWGKKVRVIADADGRWRAELRTPGASFEPQSIQFSGGNEHTLENVLIGEVWLCSGQSNMGWSVRQSNRPEEEAANADYPGIRFFKAPTRMAWEPQDDVEAEWVTCSPETISAQSAVAYFFGRELIRELDVPIGLVVSAFGASNVDAWLEPKLARKYGFGNIVDWFEEHRSDMRSIQEKWRLDLEAWKAEQKNEDKPDFRTRPKRRLPGDQQIPFGLYNGMLHPLVGYSIRGVIWYQGESNVPRANQYRSLFPAMIHSWRDLWDQGDFPFYYVQIAPFHYKEPDGVSGAELRDAQREALAVVKKTGMAVLSDIGNNDNIHPRNKQDVGKRLAMMALNRDHGQGRGNDSSPIYRSHSVSKGRISIRFDHAERLIVEGDKILGFTIAGEDKVFVSAEARIVGDRRVEVWSESIERPVAVRYGWSNAVKLNLFNEINLPVSTFKTDNWSDTTEGLLYIDFPQR